jgi:ABC-type antimicrobial peptide transport system permease subunit
VAVIGFDVADRLYSGIDQIGKEIRIAGLPFRIIGVLAQRSSGLGNNRNLMVVIPITSFQRMFGAHRSLTISIKAVSMDQVNACIDQTRLAMRTLRRLGPKREDNFAITTSENMLKLWESISSRIFGMVSYTSFIATMGRGTYPQVIAAAVRDGFTVEEAKEEIIRIMRVQRKLKANQDNDFAVVSSDAALEFITKITAPIAMILASISSIALLVGGIGVMNMMLVSVIERTGEIGIRKAVGAKRQDILWQFLIEAGCLTGIGGVLGVLVGLSAAFGVSRLTGLPFSLSPVYILLAVAFSVGIGMFFGLYPANRASKLQPISAIGYAK